MIDKAIEYAEFVPVYRLNSNTKIPFKGSNGYLDATQDVKQIKEWWKETPNANIACVPAINGYFVLDLDHPSGIKSLEQLGIWQKLAQEKTFQAYRTTSGGIHIWFKTDSKIIMEQSRIDLWKDVDILSSGHGVIVPPSKVNGSPYEGKFDLSKIPDVPEWLEKTIEQEIENIGNFKTHYSSNNFSSFNGKNYTGVLLDRIVKGTSSGGRNVWLTSITGSLFNSGMEIENILVLMQIINEEFIHPPLNNNEIVAIYKSILKREGGIG